MKTPWSQTDWNRVLVYGLGVSGVAATALASCDTRLRWTDLRLVLGRDASDLERAACADVQALFEQATGATPPIVEETRDFGHLDIVVGTPESTETFTVPS